MTDVAANSSMSCGVTQRQTEPPAGPPTIVSARVRAITYAIVVLAHVGVFAAFITWAKPDVIALDSLTMDLVQEGDFFEAEEVAAAEDTPPPEVVEEPELALPPPEVMSPDAPQLPAMQKEEQVEKKVEPTETQNAQQAREAQASDMRARPMAAPRAQAFRNRPVLRMSPPICADTRRDRRTLVPVTQPSRSM
jgi:protein TonB